MLIIDWSDTDNDCFIIYGYLIMSIIYAYSASLSRIYDLAAAQITRGDCNLNGNLNLKT
jgi:hypothetical protein